MAKPHKVQEPAGTYSAKKIPAKVAATPEQPTIRYADNATFRKNADKVFKTHANLFRKLAQ